MKFAFALLLAAVSLHGVASAAPVDNSVITTLERTAAWAPTDGAACSDLAIAYLKAGRVADARAAFDRVLTLDNVTLTTISGEDIWSHQLARRALRDDLTIASR
jgi:DNA-binding SARP family transcriptional activator